MLLSLGLVQRLARTKQEREKDGQHPENRILMRLRVG
jgi:hypothetical protein